MLLLDAWTLTPFTQVGTRMNTSLVMMGVITPPEKPDGTLGREIQIQDTVSRWPNVDPR